MNYRVSSLQYIGLLAVAAFITFFFARYMVWNLTDNVVLATTVAVTSVVFSAFIFCLQYVRGRYLAD
jgi:hypothetical protein